MSATGLILLILFLIGAGLALYYAVICMQARPKTPKAPLYPDMHPLINPHDHDMNGNHEDSSRPANSIDQPDSAPPPPKTKDPADPPPSTDKSENGLEPPLKSVTFQSVPECASKDPKENSVILPIDEEPSLNCSKPLIQPLEAPMKAGRNPPPRMHPPPPPQAMPAKAPHHVVPIPMIVSDVPLKAMSVSYEEDGLLVPRSPPPDVHPPAFEKRPESEPQPQARPKMHPPKHVQFIAPFVNPAFIVDSSQPQQGAQPVENRPLAEQRRQEHPVPDHKHKAEESLGNAPKKVRMEHQESLPEKELVKEVPETVVPNLQKNASPSSNDSSDSPINAASIPKDFPPPDSATSIHPKSDDEVMEPLSAANDPRPPLGWCVVPIAQEGFDPANESVHSSRDEVTERATPLARIAEVEEREPDSAETLPCHDAHFASPSEAAADSEEAAVVRVKVTLPSDDDEERPENSSPDSHLGTSSDTSDPEVTEYSFEDGPSFPSTMSVLANEVSSYSENKVGLTNYVALPESETSPNSNTPPSKEKRPSDLGHPLTPTSDTTKSPSPLSSVDTSLDDMNPAINPNVLSTPPSTPPEGKNSPSFIIANPSANLSEPLPTYIVLEPHDPRPRSASASSSSSSSSSASSSTSNGSYKIDGVKDDKMEAQQHLPNLDRKTTKMPRLKE